MSGKIFTCPKCGRKLKQVNKEELYCSGKTSEHAIGHGIVKMV